MRHPKVLDWEARLKAVFDEIDRRIEAQYGKQYPLHPARALHGSTANPEQDGLFDLGAAFSPGYGSHLGPGYSIEIRMATLSRVPAPIRAQIEQQVIDLLKELLPGAFPDRALKVSRDGSLFKIHGDLKLGSV